MDKVRRLSRSTSMALYIIMGIFFMVMMGGNANHDLALFLVTVGVWILGLIILFFTMSRRVYERIFTTLFTIFFMGVGAMVEYYCNTDYIIYLIMLLEWIMAALVVNKSYLRFLGVFHILVIAGLAAVGKLNENGVLLAFDLIILMATIIIAFWITNSLTNALLSIARERDDLELSMDDLLRIVFSKKREASKAVKIKSNFLATMSHEIRTPINTILGMNEMILREEENTDIREYSVNIKNASNMLLSLINDILDFSKIESGRMSLIMFEYNLSDIVGDLYKMIATRMEREGLELRIIVDEKLPSRYYGDEVRIKQIILNLLTNGLKYTDKGSVTLRIEGESLEERTKLKVYVEDTGMGIKDQDIDRLTQSFVRMDEEKNRKIEGTGLGLSIVSDLLRLMNSELKVESTYGEGSVFYFELEQPVVDYTPIGNLDDMLKEAAKNLDQKEYYHHSFEAPDAKLLVVDDNYLNLKVFKSLIKKTKCQIDLAESGEEALTYTAKTKYDIIFMDHMMPKMDGVQTLDRIRKDDNSLNRKTKVIALTANAISGADKIYKSLGFDDYITKPVEPARLEDTISNTLPRRKVKMIERDEDEQVESSRNISANVENKKTETEQTKSAEVEKPENNKPANDINAIAPYQSMPMVEGLDLFSGYKRFNDVDFYQSTIADYAANLKKDAEDAMELYNKAISRTTPNYEDFRVKVHGMKSGANLIGLFPVAGLSATMEFAARDGRYQLIEEMMPHFVTEVSRYADNLQEKYPVTEEE